MQVLLFQNMKDISKTVLFYIYILYKLKNVAQTIQSPIWTSLTFESWILLFWVLWFSKKVLFPSFLNFKLFSIKVSSRCQEIWQGCWMSLWDDLVFCQCQWSKFFLLMCYAPFPLLDLINGMRNISACLSTLNLREGLIKL